MWQAKHSRVVDECDDVSRRRRKRHAAAGAWLRSRKAHCLYHALEVACKQSGRAWDPPLTLCDILVANLRACTATPAVRLPNSVAVRSIVSKGAEKAAAASQVGSGSCIGPMRAR